VDNLEDKVERLLERADRPAAPAWMPNKPSEGHPSAIAGEVVENAFKPGAGYEGRGLTVVTVRQPDGVEWAVWCTGRILAQDLAGVPVGAVVAISYLGRQQGKGSEYEGWRVVVDRGDLVEASQGPPLERRVEHEHTEPVRAPAPEPPAIAAADCGTCGGRQGRHASGCPAAAAPTVCNSCGFLNGHHREGCPDDIPF
jgi:hypothetical protein